MLLFYLNCTYTSIKSSHKASFSVEIAFGQNVPLCTFTWPNRLWPKRLGQNVCPPFFIDIGIKRPFKTVLEKGESIGYFFFLSTFSLSMLYPPFKSHCQTDQRFDDSQEEHN